MRGSADWFTYWKKAWNTPHGQLAAEQLPAGKDGNAHLPQAVDQPDGGVDGVHHKVGLLRGLGQFLGGSVNLPGAGLLPAEGLDRS